MFQKFPVVVLVIVAALQSGCGPRPVTGGSEGVLRAGGELLSDIQVTVYQLEGGSWRPVGFGVSSNGAFELVTQGAQGPLVLSPGEYRCTLESVGAPVKIPDDYARVDTTPLKISRSASDQSLNLEISTPFVAN